MGTRTQHTKTDLSRCVARLLLAAQHARLAVGSRRGGPPLVRVRFGGNSPPLPTNWSVLFSSEYFFALSRSCGRAFFAVVVPKQRSVLGTVAPRVCCLQLVPQRRRPSALRVGAERRFPRSPKAEKPRSLRRIDFFLNCFWKFDFGSFFRDAHLSAAPGSSSSSSSSSCSLKTTTVGARTSLWA